MNSMQLGSPEQALHKLIFIGGLHASGTSLIHRLICMHPSVSGFSDTGVPEDEGQHLQDLYPRASAHGGPGRFVFDDSSHLTDANRDFVEKCSRGLWNCWAPYWDLSKPVLVEKSPPNIIRSRFLETVFPSARFIFVIWHPIPVSIATQKWTKQPLEELLQHWVLAHKLFLDDLKHITSWAWFRYEDLTADPHRILAEIFRFAGLAPISPKRFLVSNGDTILRKRLISFETQLRKLSRRVGASSVRPREFIVDSNAKYLSATNSNEFKDTMGLEVLEAFGYKLDSPYYTLAPGMGSIITNITRAATGSSQGLTVSQLQC